MSVSLRKKLRLLPGMKVLTLDAPVNHLKTLNAENGDLTGGAKMKDFGQVHWFVKSQKQVEVGVDNIKKLLAGDIICWVFFPKSSSGLQTDLTRDVGWQPLLEGEEFQWLTLVSFDETWSAFSIRKKATEKVPSKGTPRKNGDSKSAEPKRAGAKLTSSKGSSPKLTSASATSPSATSTTAISTGGPSRVSTAKPAAPRLREILEYIDPIKKTVRVPEDLQSALKADKKAGAAFEKLAFSHRKEYVEWIVTAKKEETRKARVAGTVEKLNLGWKNPRNL